MNSGIHKIQDPLERLHQSLRHTLKFMMENRRMFLFVYTETKFLDMEHLRIVLEMDDKKVVGFFREIIKEGVEAGVLDVQEPDLMANIIAYLLVLFPMRGWNLKHYPSEKIIQEIVKFVLKGVCRLSSRTDPKGEEV